MTNINFEDLIHRNGPEKDPDEPIQEDDIIEIDLDDDDYDDDDDDDYDYDDDDY